MKNGSARTGFSGIDRRKILASATFADNLHKFIVIEGGEQGKTRGWMRPNTRKRLLQRHTWFWFPVRGQYLEMMDVSRNRMIALPNNLVVARHFNHRNTLRHTVTAYNCVAIGKALGAARVVEYAAHLFV